jgi:hypothetical protein
MEINIVKNFVSNEKCDELSSMIAKANEENKLKLWGQARVLYKPEPEYQQFIDVCSYNFIQQCRTLYEYEGKLWPEQQYFFAWVEGSEHQQHFDNNDMAFEHQGIKKEFRPYGLPELKFSSILYLNDNYEGGEIFFPRLGKTIKPEKGDWVIFESDNINLEHGVKMITEGTRYTLAMWLQTDPK